MVWQNSEFHEDCDRLMTAVANARDILIDPERKPKYDERLRGRLGIEDGPETDEDFADVTLAPLPPRIKGHRQPIERDTAEAGESAPDYDNVFLFGLGGLVAVFVLVGAVVMLLRDFGQPSDPANSIGMKFVLLPAGDFLMGSPEDEPLHKVDEKQHRVSITQPFYLQTTEVTQGQWKDVMGTTPWRGRRGVNENADCAASYVSWDDAQKFCLALGQTDGKTYRLPTEAEWEYACRAGTTTKYQFADDPARLGDYAWFGKNAYDIDEKYAHEVGQKKPNGFGLYDTHGNVWEWCQDRYDDEYYAASPTADPTGHGSRRPRVLRGGSWRYNAESCRSAFRRRDSPGYRNYYLGLRVVCELE